MQASALEKPTGIEDALHEVSKIRSIVTDTVENSVRSANQVIKHGRQAAEDAIEEAKYAVKQRPFQSIGAAFAAGILTGGLLAWVGLRRR